MTDQRTHWETTYGANPHLYGPGPSAPGGYALRLFTRAGCGTVLELGAGQGRDTLPFLQAGFRVTALDYSATALAELEKAAAAEGWADALTTVVHDVREPLPLADWSVDAVYSHMLFSMGLTTADLDRLAAEVHRVLRRGGLHVYTVRHIGDPHYGQGTDLGDDIFENGGFAVHFFSRALVVRLAEGCTVHEIAEFSEGDLPRRLWRVTLRAD